MPGNNDRLNNGADLVTSFGSTTAQVAVVNKILYINGDANGVATDDNITINDAGANVNVVVNGVTTTISRASFRGGRASRVRAHRPSRRGWAARRGCGRSWPRG